MLARLELVLAESAQSGWCKHVATDLEGAICRVPDWPLKKLKAKCIRAALKSAFKKARQGLARLTTVQDAGSQHLKHPTDIDIKRLLRRIFHKEHRSTPWQRQFNPPPENQYNTAI